MKRIKRILRGEKIIKMSDQFEGDKCKLARCYWDTMPVYEDELWGIG